MRMVPILLCLILLGGAAFAGLVQWPVSEGGNGHFYEVLGGYGSEYDGIDWVQADVAARMRSGHLVTITSSAELDFLTNLPEIHCGFFPGDPVCNSWHLGGWSIITEIYDPRPYDPPYVGTAGGYWITGEHGWTAYPSYGVSGPLGATLYFKLGMVDWDTFGLPTFYAYADTGPSTANGFIVEYDGLAACCYPDNTVGTTESSWGSLKALYR